MVQLSGNLPEDVNEEAVQDIGSVNGCYLLFGLVFDKKEHDPEDSHQIELTLFLDNVILARKGLKNRSVFFVYSVGQLHIVDLYTQPLRTFPPFVALTSHHLQQRLL